jgi:hypothetical protein
VKREKAFKHEYYVIHPLYGKPEMSDETRNE